MRTGMFTNLLVAVTAYPCKGLSGTFYVSTKHVLTSQSTDWLYEWISREGPIYVCVCVCVCITEIILLYTWN